VSGSEFAAGADVPHPPAVPPLWTVENLLNHLDGTWTAVWVRNTTGAEFTVDRAVAAAGHGDHNGWYITPDLDVACGGPGCSVLFHLSAAIDPRALGLGDDPPAASEPRVAA